MSFNGVSVIVFHLIYNNSFCHFVTNSYPRVSMTLDNTFHVKKQEKSFERVIKYYFNNYNLHG